MIKDKFFQGGQEIRQYQGFFNIVCDYLPAPQLGMGLEKGKKEYLLGPSQNLYRQRLERLPLKNGNIKMCAQAFRIALIGSKAFEKSGVIYKSLFYSLGMM
jgi:hypothetical protein